MKEEQDRRTLLLEAAAAAENRLIADEIAAENELRDAEQKLAKAKRELQEYVDIIKQRQAKVDSARAILAAVQQQRAAGPGA
jgi:hypothetical protein